MFIGVYYLYNLYRFLRCIFFPGAMLTHRNYTATVSGVCTHMNQEPWKSRYRFGPEDVSISYLPLAHTFEQVVANTLLAHGGELIDSS